MERRGALISWRGQGHLEVILSFVIFIAALGFALYFFRPTNTARLADTSLDYVFRAIEKNASTIVVEYSVKIDNASIIEDNNKEGNHDKKILKLKKPRGLQTFPTLVKTRGGTILNSDSSDGLNIKIKSDSGWEGIDFIFLDFNENFTSDSVSGSELPNDKYYTLGGSYSDNVISKDVVLRLNKTYYADYYALKSSFNIPTKVNFGFALQLDSESISTMNTVPRGLPIFSQQRREKVLDNGQVVYGNLIVNVW